MTEARDSSIDALLAAARAQYAASLPAKAESIAACVERGAWEEARREAHKLRGSSATYGFAALGSAAAALEEAILASEERVADAVRARLAEAVRAVRAAARSAAERMR